MIIFPEDSILSSKKRVKFGIDPTAPKLHLGHLVPLRRVRKFQEAGNPVTIVLGTFTACLGDPSGRDETRPILSQSDVDKNAYSIQRQIEKILLPEYKLYFNNDDLGTMKLWQFMRIASSFTVSRMLSRDGFQKRMENNSPIALHELLVPICQGLDSVVLQAEIEVGGQDQLFNFQVARQLQEINGQMPQACVLCPIINGTDGRKMSKSLNNCIFLEDTPTDIYGKVMSISDDVMKEWIPVLTDINPEGHPMECKKALAFDLVRQIHGLEAATEAQEGFRRVVQDKRPPEAILEVRTASVLTAIMEMRKCSKAEARRLLLQNAVAVDDKIVTDESIVTSGQIVRVGRRDYCKIIDI